LLCRFHTQTAGCSLTAQQPYNNVVRTALQALAAVLGGTQSLHTNSLDEAWALPTEQAALLALRTQQVIAHESGVTAVADPLGGSYFLERLTQDTERDTWDYFRKIDAMGGMIAAIERGFPQREIADSSYEFQRALETKDKVMVGVNRFTSNEETPLPLLVIDETAAAQQSEKLRHLRATRDNALVSETLRALEKVARGTANTMPCILDCVRAYATLGEICDAFRGVFGTYEETSIT